VAEAGTSSVLISVASALATTDCRRETPGDEGLGDSESEDDESDSEAADGTDNGDVAGTWRLSSVGCTTGGWMGVGSSSVTSGQTVGTVGEDRWGDFNGGGGGCRGGDDDGGDGSCEG
jgi:hypothetical protein